MFLTIGKSAEHRQRKANGVLRRWAPLLLNLSLLLHERMNGSVSCLCCILSALVGELSDTHEDSVRQVGLVVCLPAVSNGLVQAEAR